MFSQPKNHFIALGSAEGKTALGSFDNALRSAGIGDINLIKISSILPPGSKQVDPYRIPPGSLVPVAYETRTSLVEGQIISAAIAIATPSSSFAPSLIMEIAGHFKKHELMDQVYDMAYEGMRQRDQKVNKVDVFGIEHQVKNIASVIAAVVLCNG